MRTITAFLVAVLLVAMPCTRVLGATPAELLQQADALAAEYDSLLDRCNECPRGDCPDRSAIEEDFAAAEAERLSLDAERAALGQCPECSGLDAALAAVQAAATVVADEIDAWDGQS